MLEQNAVSMSSPSAAPHVHRFSRRFNSAISASSIMTLTNIGSYDIIITTCVHAWHVATYRVHLGIILDALGPFRKAKRR